MKKPKRIIILFIVLAAIGAGAFQYLKMAARPTRVLRLNVGDEFIITLNSNRTTGYEWQIDRPLDGNKIKQAGLVYVPQKTDLVGSGGKEEWKFKAKETGKSKISFKYVRPWEKGVKPADKKEFDVEIKKI